MKINTRENRLKLLNMMWWIPDKIMICLQFRIVMKKKLDLKKVSTFNEKLQWLKLYDRNPNHSVMVDKYKVRKLVEKKIGKEYLIPLLGCWNKYEDIDFYNLPEKFVLKCNHDSGSIKIISDKTLIDHKKLKKFFNQRLRQNPYRYGREWPYKNVRPCIIAEKYMCDEKGNPPVDYKFFCFNGYVDSVMICVGRGTLEKKFYFFSRDWKLKKYNYSSQNLSDDFTINQPEGIGKLFDLAEKLSIGEAFVRIDFYLIDGIPYFGEFTYFPASGLDNKLMPWADEYLGKFINFKVVKKRNRK